MVIHAGTSGGLDDFPTKRVQEFEAAFRSFMRESHPEVGREILETKAVSDKLKAVIDAAIKTVKGQLGVAKSPAPGQVQAAKTENKAKAK